MNDQSRDGENTPISPGEENWLGFGNAQYAVKRGGQNEKGTG
jgi:hypothetical protein